MTFLPYNTQTLLPLVWPGQLPINVTGVNGLYYVARQHMLNATFNWLTGTKYAYLVTPDYTFDYAHTTLADIPSGARLSSAEILSRSINSHGWACSIGIEFVDVLPAVSLEPASAVIFTEGTAESSELIAHFSSVIELPFEPDGRSWYFLPNGVEGGAGAGSGGWWSP